MSATKLMNVLKVRLMQALGMDSKSCFLLYAVLTAIFIASRFIFQSKDMRSLIFMPDCDRHRSAPGIRHPVARAVRGALHQLLLVEGGACLHWTGITPGFL